MSTRQNIILTGGIASGKTFASDYLASLNAHVIDTDVIARALLLKDGNIYANQALQEIRKYFGNDVFLDDQIDRKKLRAIVFNDPAAKTALEQITHPLIFKIVSEEMMPNKGLYNLISVPLLHESSPYLDLADKVLVIEVDVQLQLQRLMQRDCIDEPLALSIIDSQVSNQARRALADTIIINTNKLHTQNVLKQLDKQYSLAPF